MSSFSNPFFILWIPHPFMNLISIIQFSVVAWVSSHCIFQGFPSTSSKTILFFVYISSFLVLMIFMPHSCFLFSMLYTFFDILLAFSERKKRWRNRKILYLFVFLFYFNVDNFLCSSRKCRLAKNINHLLFVMFLEEKKKNRFKQHVS